VVEKQRQDLADRLHVPNDEGLPIRTPCKHIRVTSNKLPNFPDERKRLPHA
jgi:hypothetical protein